MKRTVRTCALTAGLLLTALAVPGHAAASASSAGRAIEISCTFSASVDYQPGFNLSPQPVHLDATGDLTNCTGAPGITSGKMTVSGNGNPISCTAGTFTLVGDIAWDNNTSSHFANTTVRTVRPNGSVVAVATGKVQSGQFAGADMTGSLVLANAAPLACLTSGGVTHTSGVGSYTLIS